MRKQQRHFSKTQTRNTGKTKKSRTTESLERRHSAAAQADKLISKKFKMHVWACLFVLRLQDVRVCLWERERQVWCHCLCPPVGPLSTA